MQLTSERLYILLADAFAGHKQLLCLAKLALPLHHVQGEVARRICVCLEHIVLALELIVSVTS